MKTARIFGRREFLKQASRTVAAVAVCQGVVPRKAQAETPGKAAGTIPALELGKTGLKLPILGYGGAALPRVWLNPLSYKDRIELVRYAYDRGLRYFDTAPGYFESQAILGEALKDRRRQVCLVTKVDTTKPEEVRKSVQSSLKALLTDYLDIILIHGTGICATDRVVLASGRTRACGGSRGCC